MSDNERPQFPDVAGARTMPDGDKERIAEAAWKMANGNRAAFQQLCAEHAQGEIDLFSENPRAIRVRDRVVGVGSDRYTATGGEVHDLSGPASAGLAGPGMASVAGGGSIASGGSIAGAGEVVTSAGTVEAGGPVGVSATEGEGGSAG